MMLKPMVCTCSIKATPKSKWKMQKCKVENENEKYEAKTCILIMFLRMGMLVIFFWTLTQTLTHKWVYLLLYNSVKPIIQRTLTQTQTPS